jgi:IS6 family transposase
MGSDRRAIRDLKQVGRLPDACERRPVKCLNNIVEQDHRFIKRSVKLGLGLGSYPTAWRTIQGYTVMHMISKGQIESVEKGDSQAQSTFIAGLFGLVA